MLPDPRRNPLKKRHKVVIEKRKMVGTVVRRGKLREKMKAVAERKNR
jgi:hypothetical protein